MDFMAKKEEVLLELRNAGLADAFEVTFENDDSILIQTEQNIGNNSRCIISLALDNRIFNSIYFGLGKLTNINKKESMLDLLNNLNSRNVILKFYMTDDGNISGETVYTAKEFKADEYVSLMIIAWQALTDEFYSKIMRVMWS